MPLQTAGCWCSCSVKCTLLETAQGVLLSSLCILFCVCGQWTLDDLNRVSCLLWLCKRQIITDAQVKPTCAILSLCRLFSTQSVFIFGVAVFSMIPMSLVWTETTDALDETDPFVVAWEFCFLFCFSDGHLCGKSTPASVSSTGTRPKKPCRRPSHRERERERRGRGRGRER